MALKERVYSILLVSNSEKTNAILKDLLPSVDYSVKEIASVSEAKRCVSEDTFDFIIINSPVGEEVGKRFAIDSCRNKSTIVLFLAPTADYAEITPDLKKRGVFVLKKPITKQTIIQAIDWMETARERLRDMEKKSQSVEEKMKDIRIINRAKLLLISELGMNEDEAHHYIEKNSMDNGISKLDVANSVIRIYS